MKGPARPDRARAQLPLLDRLIDDAPNLTSDPPLSPADAIASLRRSVKRDLEALLNARRMWRSWPAHLAELKTSSVGYGVPDFAGGAFNDPARRERLRAEIEATIRRFEPRFASVRVQMLDNRDEREPLLRMRIEALLRVEPAPEPITLETLLDPTSAEVTVRDGGEAIRERVDG